MHKTNQNYKNRRDALVALIATEHAAFTGPIMLFAPCDNPNGLFVQDSTFYYFSGIVEPASVMVLNKTGQIFYQPAYTAMRDAWIASSVKITQDYIQSIGFDGLQTTGQKVDSMHIYPYFDFTAYQSIISFITESLHRGEKIFTMYPTNSSQSWMTHIIIDRLSLVIPHLQENIIDISSQIAQLRRKKDMSEIETMYKAIDMSIQGHYAAVTQCKAGNKESDMQAALEYVFTENLATAAYPSIVASGIHGTILHYNHNNKKLIEGDLVVVDAGARYNYYCADITRTYPVSGKFSDEQKKLYELVLECQELVAEHAKPGMWLSNKDNQEMSLHHIAVNFFKKHDLDQYFTHGIGHFLGLDVHDVGDRSRALQEGDVITIEPGLYIPEKKIGIRIEDNYWIVDQTEPVCLSEGLPKTVQAVEEMMQQAFEVDLE